MLNGKRCNSRVGPVEAGDQIGLMKKAKNIPAVLEAIASVERDVPEYVEVDHIKFTATLVRVPT